jgi:hypothetical protein
MEIEEKMDARDDYFQKLKRIWLETGKVQEGHEEAFEIGKKEGFRSWRKNRKVVRKIAKAKRRMSNK